MDKSGGNVEGLTLNSTYGNSAGVVSGGRRHMKKVSAKTIKKTLKRLGMKPKGRVVIRGGEIADDKEGQGGIVGARRRRHTKKTHRRSKGLFGMRALRY
jgi:hypothetical protein